MALLDDAFALIGLTVRRISYLLPHVVVQEHHRDDLMITDHPVETGAAISDHAFKRPAEVEIQCGWSNSTIGARGYVRLVYQQLLAIQAMREPFTLSTGKRSYSNMLLAGIAVTTDQKTEEVLMVTARAREIIIVYTQTTSAPASAQASPSQTQSTSGGGWSQVSPVTVQNLPPPAGATRTP